MAATLGPFTDTEVWPLVVTPDPANPLNLNGSVVVAAVREINGGPVIADLSSADGEIVVTADAGGNFTRIDFSITDAMRTPSEGEPWRTPRSTTVFFDVYRILPPSTERHRFASVTLSIEPGSDSEAIDDRQYQPVRSSSRTARVASASAQIPGPQGGVSPDVAAALAEMATAFANQATRQIQLYTEQVEA